jgi:hypothetical protein
MSKMPSMNRQGALSTERPTPAPPTKYTGPAANQSIPGLSCPLFFSILAIPLGGTGIYNLAMRSTDFKTKGKNNNDHLSLVWH